MPPRRLEPPDWLDPDVWSGLDEEPDFADLRPFRNFVVAHHAELRAIWWEVTRRNATDRQEKGLKLDSFLTPAPARFSEELEGDEEERQRWAFLKLIEIALDAHAQRVRIDIVGDYDDDYPDIEKTVIRVGRIVVPKGVDRGAFVHAMGVLHRTVNFSVYLYGGRPQKSAACRLVKLLTGGVDLKPEQAHSLVSKKLAKDIAALVRQDERDADWERLIAKARSAKKYFTGLVDDYYARQADPAGREPPPPPPAPADAS
jgi:hypothetical protein